MAWTRKLSAAAVILLLCVWSTLASRNGVQATLQTRAAQQMQWGAGATNRRNLLNQEIAAASPASTGISTGTSTLSLGSSAATPAQPVLESLAPSPANQDNSGSGLTVFPLPTAAAPHSGQQTPAAALTPITSTGTNGGGSTAGSSYNASSRVEPTSQECDIFTATSTIQCLVDSKLPIPGCCASTTAGGPCTTRTNGTGGNCTTAMPYPACCYARNQPVSACIEPNTQEANCYDNFPVPGCCNSTMCQVSAYANDLTCTSGAVGCCPA